MKLNRREFLFGKRAFCEDDKGATAIEYGLIAGVIALAAKSDRWLRRRPMWRALRRKRQQK